MKFLNPLENIVMRARYALYEYLIQRKPPKIEIDIELTNSCNTACAFCPRSKTPEQGFIGQKEFEKTVQRIKEMKPLPSVNLCGLGEPLLHPNVVEFVSYLTEEGLSPNITTNGYLLSRELSQKLINAGLKELGFSVSGVNETYEKIHHLKFEVVKNNIVEFLSMSERRCRPKFSITICDFNKDEIDNTVAFWKNLGINKYTIYDQINRGGNLDIDYYFTRSKRYYHEAKSILADNGLSTLCMVPFKYIFIGWNGNYYMCCHDFAKKTPLGKVFEYSIDEINAIKKQRLLSGLDICKNCDLDRINMIREILFRIENKEATDADLENKLSELASARLRID